MNPSAETEFPSTVPEIVPHITPSSLQETTSIKIPSTTAIHRFADISQQGDSERPIALSLYPDSCTETVAGKDTQVASKSVHQSSQTAQPSDTDAISPETRPLCISINSSHEPDCCTTFANISDSSKAESTVIQETHRELRSGTRAFRSTPGLDVTVISPTPSPPITKADSAGQTPPTQRSPVTVFVQPPSSPLSTRSLRKKRKQNVEESGNLMDTRASKRKHENKASTSVGPNVDFSHPPKKTKRLRARISKSSKMSPIQLLPTVIHKKAISSLAKPKKSLHGIPNMAVQPDSVNGCITDPLPSNPSPASEKIAMHASVPPVCTSNHCSGSSHTFLTSTGMHMAVTEVQSSYLRTGRNTATCTDLSISSQNNMPPPFAKQTVMPSHLSYDDVLNETSISSGGNVTSLLLPTGSSLTTSYNLSDSNTLSDSSTLLFSTSNALVSPPIVSPSTSRITAISSTRESVDTNSGCDETVTTSCQNMSPNTSISATTSFPVSKQHLSSTPFSSVVTAMIQSLMNSSILSQQKLTSLSTNLAVVGMPGAKSGCSTAPCSIIWNSTRLGSNVAVPCFHFRPPLHQTQQCYLKQSLTPSSVTAHHNSSKVCSKEDCSGEKSDDEQSVGGTVHSTAVSLHASSVTQSAVKDIFTKPRLLSNSPRDGAEFLKNLSSTPNLADSSTLSSTCKTSVVHVASLGSTDGLFHSLLEDSSLNNTAGTVSKTSDASEEGSASVMENEVFDQVTSEDVEMCMLPKDMETGENLEDVENVASEVIDFNPGAVQISASSPKADASEVHGKDVPKTALPDCITVTQQTHSQYAACRLDQAESNISELVNPDLINDDVRVSEPSLSAASVSGTLDTTCICEHVIASNLPTSYPVSSVGNAISDIRCGNSISSSKSQMDSDDNDVVTEPTTMPLCKSAVTSVFGVDVEPRTVIDAGSSSPGTPTHQVYCLDSPKTTPAGILKHTSQFDSPSSASKVSCGIHMSCLLLWFIHVTYHNLVMTSIEVIS